MKIKLLLVMLFVVLITLSGFIIFLEFKEHKQEDTSLTESKFSTEDAYKAFIEEEEYEGTQDNLQPIDNTMNYSAWITYWDFQNAVNSYKAHPAFFDSLSPTWYFLKPDGTLGLRNTARNEELISLCKTNRTKLIPSIANSNAQEFSNIINNPELLQRHIQTIVTEVTTYGYDGIDIDYEAIKKDDRDQFTSFIKTLSNELHNQNKILTIAILWKNDLETVIEQKSEARAAQDWSVLGESVDEFRIMAYDYTHSTDSAGPIAPQEWIGSILDYALKKVDNKKIVLGLPLYAYVWNENQKGANALVWTDIEKMRNNKQYSIIQDEFNQTYFEKELHYKKENTIQIIWYQDSEVTLKRVELSETYGINKIVFWRLGGEDPGIYKFEN